MVQKISDQQKINIVFNYLFDGDKALEEEFFWNELSKEELIDLEKQKQSNVFYSREALL